MDKNPTCWLFHLLLGAAIFGATSAFACTIREGEKTPTATIPLRYSKNSGGTFYHVELLNLALQKAAPSYGPCQAQIAQLYLPSTRFNLHSVESGLVDVIDTTTSPERNKRLIPIRIPILKGLMGYRILFIQRGKQPFFSAITSYQQLREVVFGQGLDWPDNEILAANELQLIHAINKENLVQMLLANRFDAYPRGSQQILLEHMEGEASKLDIEQSIGLAYVSPSYFHVGHHNSELAKRLQYGLNKAIEDGSFDTLYYNHPLIKRIFNELNLKKRRFFFLCHPNLHPETPVDNTEYWWRPWPKQTSCKKT